MCLLMVTMGQLPNREYLENACYNNSDGFGYAVNHGDHIVSGRGMKVDRTIDRFFEEMQSNPNAIGMFHARYTTHGITHVDNNHPFRVGGRKDILLGHNGMLPVSLKKGDKRSDTRIFAEDLLPSMGIDVLDDKSYFKQLEQWAGGSKVALLSTAPELRDSVYILNESLGHWDKDIWWSNDTYQYKYAYTYSTSYYPTNSWEQDMLDKDKTMLIGSMDLIGGHDYTGTDVCYFCYAEIDDEDWDKGYCDKCSTCLDCIEHVNVCMCYTPNSTVRNNGYWWNE